MKQQGSSLVESLLVITVLGSIVFLLANIPNSLYLINKSKHLSLAREIAAKQIEDIRLIQYANLTSGTILLNDSRINLIPNGSGLVKIGGCNNSVCTNEEHVKQVKVTVNWKDANTDQAVNLETLVGEGGLN